MTTPDGPRTNAGAEDDAARWSAVQALVDAALDLPASERADFVANALADDDVRSDAARWLAACERAERTGDFLAQPAAERAAPLLSAIARTGALDEGAPNVLRHALAGTYAIESELGRGGMATVYLARDLRHHRPVAIKVLHPELAAALGGERFVREIELTASLQHPHILPLFDSGAAEGQLYYVMPYVEGETLQRRLAREPRLTLNETVRLLRDVASALAYAHRRGIVHRDVKPANILLADGHAVVADLGIARAIHRARAVRSDDAPAAGDEPAASAQPRGASSADTLTGAGTSPGTPAYMAPEQTRAGAAVDHRADLYALGVVAYEALAGAHPFGPRSPRSIMAAHAGEPIAPLATRRSDVPPALAALVMRLLEKDPARRPQSAEEVLTALDDLHSSAVPTTRRRTWVRGAVALGVLLAAIGTYAVRRGDSSAAPHDGALAAASRAPVNAIAVIPFVNGQGASSDDYFSDGMTDELARALAKLPGMRVAGRASSYDYKGKQASAQEIGRALNVGAVVEGTVRRADGRLGVSTKLVSTADGRVLWDSVYESRSGDVFAVQDELTRAIVAALAPALGGRVSVGGARGTADQEAYELYLKGRYFWLQRGAANITRSIALYQAAVARDPAFARAYAGLAMAYSTLPNYAAGTTDSAAAMVSLNARRALALDSTLADAQLALGIMLDGQLHFRDALARYRAAVQRDPSSVTGHHWLGMSLLNLGRTREAFVELSHAAELDPLAPTPSSAVALALMYERRYPEARAASRRVLALDSTFTFAIWTLGIAQAFGGQPDSAVRTFERGARLHPEDPRMAAGLALSHAAAGRWKDAEHIRAQLHRSGATNPGWGDAELVDLAFGDRAPLVRLLTSEAGQRRFVASGGILGCNPLFDPLRADSAFVTAMRRLTEEPCGQARQWPFAR
jgi:eukaryotic-like serine/threonine-protein kinase